MHISSLVESPPYVYQCNQDSREYNRDARNTLPLQVTIFGDFVTLYHAIVGYSVTLSHVNVILVGYSDTLGHSILIASVPLGIAISLLCVILPRYVMLFR